MIATADLFDFVTTVLAPRDGVHGWTASMEMMAAKRGFITTPWQEARTRAGGA